MGQVRREVDVVVGHAIAVVVDAVADLGRIGRWGALELAPVSQIEVAVHVAVRARAEPAASAAAGGRRVARVAHSTAAPAVVGVTAEVEVFVRDTVAVIVLAVARLHAAVLRRAELLAAIRCVTVGVRVTGCARLNGAARVTTRHGAVRRGAAVARFEHAATAAVLHIGRLVEAVVHDAVTVVVNLVALLDTLARDEAARLAAVGVHAVRVREPRLTRCEGAGRVHAARPSVREAATNAARAAVLGVNLPVKALVHVAIAVVVLEVTDLGTRTYRRAGRLASVCRDAV